MNPVKQGICFTTADLKLHLVMQPDFLKSFDSAPDWFQRKQSKGFKKVS